MARLTARAIEEVRDRVPLADVVGRDVALAKAGQEFKGLCPFHNDTSPSFYVIPKKRRYHCFACGAGGDVIDYVMARRGLAFREAAELLASENGLGELQFEADPKREAELAEKRARAEAEERKQLTRRVDAARVIWREALAINPACGRGVFAALDYVRDRGLAALDWPPSLRAHPRLKHKARGEGRRGGVKVTETYWPALVGVMTRGAREFCGVWRIYLDPAGPGGRTIKAPVDNPKMGLGIAAGAAVRLGPIAEHIVVVEGIETGLAVREALLDRPGLSVWCGLSAGGVGSIDIPRGGGVRAVTILADNDADKTGIGHRKARQAAARLAGHGLVARWSVPPEPGADWLDVMTKSEGVPA